MVMASSASAPKADFVLVTDIHQDHLDEKALAQVKKDGAVVLGPRAPDAGNPAGAQ